MRYAHTCFASLAEDHEPATAAARAAGGTTSRANVAIRNKSSAALVKFPAASQGSYRGRPNNNGAKTADDPANDRERALLAVTSSDGHTRPKRGNARRWLVDARYRREVADTRRGDRGVAAAPAGARPPRRKRRQTAGQTERNPRGSCLSRLGPRIIRQRRVQQSVLRSRAR